MAAVTYDNLLPLVQGLPRRDRQKPFRYLRDTEVWDKALMESVEPLYRRTDSALPEAVDADIQTALEEVRSRKARRRRPG
ncbi:MAG: hypothetical protein COZ05_21050 [Armatimonadetes bacterium CG_4_10_14_3_um_filter_59_10]|nr:MAG: hypothetical protein COZ56_02650 [Armatimonadetes bacterium CG_4_8_14_3_um_filter_58_9]PIY38260.1 MAG: hypothetical protein COZ05_21050 [Armatimonadetes bacterium CG_4_10_14_3_um_filter_59_10]